MTETHARSGLRRAPACRRVARWLLGTLALAVAACGGGGASVPDGGSPDGHVPVTASPQVPVAVQGRIGCALDADCAEGLFCFQGACARECATAGDCGTNRTCTARGRCVGPARDLDDPGTPIDVEAGLAIVATPERVQQVSVGVAVIDVPITVSPASTQGAIAYRVERTDNQGDPLLVRRAEGTTDFTLKVDTGAANPGATEPSAVEVYVITSAGGFRLTLIPQLPFAGTYAGNASIDQFGQTGLPIDFQIVTNPAAASLDQATEAWVVLPVGPDKLFSPHEKTTAADVDEIMTRPLVKDAFTGRWVATFVSEFRLGSSSILAAGAIDGQVRRTIRLELEPQGAKTVIGAISDRWTGLYDSRPDLGARAPANVTFEGTVELTRISGAKPYTEVTPPQTVASGTPQPLPDPLVDQCTDSHFSVAAISGYTCTGLTNVTQYKAATPAQQASCAIAIARTALQGQTTGTQIQAFLENTNPSGESFADFMKRCAAGESGTCRPTTAVLCGRQLVAYTFVRLTADLPSSADLVLAYQDTTREAFLGRQLGAFQTDADTRLTWLKTTDYPAIVTSAVKDLITQLLNDWVANVLDVHLGVLAGQFDASGLAVLSQAAVGSAVPARKQLLLEMSQSWRGATDALVLATARWNQLYQDDASRAAKTAMVSRRMFDLYLLAGLLTNLNRDSGASFASGAFAGGFAHLMSQLSGLMLPFDRLVYARDAEVVVSTSVDPQSDNKTLLSERKTAALAEVTAAATAVSAVIAQSQAEALQQATLTNKMGNDINDLRTEMVELCGLPVGCTVDTFRTDPTCAVRTAAGQCGFLIDHETNEYQSFDSGESVSAAGGKLLAIRQAILKYNQAEEEVRALNARANLQLETTTAFAAYVQAAHATRLQAIADTRAAIAARQVGRDGEIADFMDNLAERQAVRQANLDGWAGYLADWDQIRLDGVTSDFKSLTAATALESTALTFRDTADSTKDLFDAMKDGLPTTVGLATDASFAARLALGVTAVGLTFGLRNGASGMEIAAKGIELSVEKERAMREAQLTNLEQVSDWEGAVSEADVARLEDLAEAAALPSGNAELQLGELIADVRAVAEAELAYQRDIQELTDRQAAQRELLIGATGLELQRQQAEAAINAAINDYLQVAQRAGLRNARLADLERQSAEINSIVGSPAAVFAWANRLDQAEQRLLRAKAKLMDWLVALEYLAVRPFLDQRLQILLARNTYQLEAIAAEIDRLQTVCGGPVNTHVADLSVRDDLLGLTVSQQDPVTGEVATAAQRFRALLQRGYVPIDKRVRYTTDATVGQLLTTSSVLAVTFSITLGDFANLAAACNAKAYSVSLQLVGDGIGTGQPTVSVLYDGTSELRSCQPGLDAYLDAIGRESTSYGSVTRLHAPGRSVSPVAGINAFPPDAASNVSLSGLPLASQYTVLIDPTLGENGKIDWSKLEDIRIRLNYTYQDLFPAGQCQ
ncbi:MAG TPA: hypothetical protein VGQ83_10145 [Polyangia bacterium]|jgi:hypothetical protein